MAGENELPAAQPAVGQQRPPASNGQRGAPSSSGQRPRPPGPNDVQSTASSKSSNPFGGMRPRPWWISFVLVLLLNYVLVQMFLPEQAQQRIDVPYTTFKEQVAGDNVSDVTSRADVIQGTFKQAVKYPPDKQDART